MHYPAESFGFISLTSDYLENLCEQTTTECDMPSAISIIHLDTKWMSEESLCL